MGRPKKLSSEIKIQIVDSFFATEAAGNPAKLKFSNLEEYAVRMGYEAKAYDFKRDQIVRDRITELKSVASGKNGTGFLQGIAYKSLDVPGIIASCKSEKELVAALAEMDEVWKKTYDACIKFRKMCEKEMSDHKQLKNELEEKTQKLEEISSELRDLKKTNKEFTTEIRYLKRMLKTYLYPAVADRILQEEGIIKNTDNYINADHAEELLDEKIPSSTSESTRRDRESISEIEQILLEMKQEME